MIATKFADDNYHFFVLSLDPKEKTNYISIANVYKSTVATNPCIIAIIILLFCSNSYIGCSSCARLDMQYVAMHSVMLLMHVHAVMFSYH